MTRSVGTRGKIWGEPTFCCKGSYGAPVVLVSLKCLVCFAGETYIPMIPIHNASFNSGSEMSLGCMLTMRMIPKNIRPVSRQLTLLQRNASQHRSRPNSYNAHLDQPVIISAQFLQDDNNSKATYDTG